MKETATKFSQSRTNWKFIATVNSVDMQQRLVDNVAQEKMSRSVEGQAMEDVESTGSVPSPKTTVRKETPALGSRMLRTCFCFPQTLIHEFGNTEEWR